MRIASIHVKGYRCLEDLRMDVDDYTVFIGANGSGKSSVLYALNWFFNGGNLTEADLYSSRGKPIVSEISVEVAFSDLNKEDRRVLGKYGRGKMATLRRTWTVDVQKMIGNALQGPGFSDVRGISNVAPMRTAYNTLRATHPELAALPGLPSKDEISAELERWEDDPANASSLVEIDDADATHMFGIAGEYTLARRMRMVLVPAAAEIADEVGAAGRGSALANLIGSLMKSAVATAKEAWETEFADQIKQLEDEIRDSVSSATQVQATRVNKRLEDLVPNATIEFSADAPTWNLGGDGSLNTDVVIDGVRNDVSRQGHGIQRAIMIAMLQAHVPDEELTKNQHKLAEGESQADADERLRIQVESLPALIVAIEEPEIYQHPVRARSFARVLSALSTRQETQVLIATHSPYFVLPEQFTALRRFCLDDGRALICTATVALIASSVGCPEPRVTKAVEKELPRTFSEGFFAEAVVFVEGDTDRVVLEALSEKLGTPFDTAGIAILSMDSKENFQVPFHILAALGVPTYVVADCDKLGAARKHPHDATAEANADASHKISTDALVGWLPSGATAMMGALPFQYGDPTLLSSRYALWHDDLENELDQWASFVAALSANGGALRTKSVASYREAAIDAGLGDMPTALKELVSAIITFCDL